MRKQWIVIPVIIVVVGIAGISINVAMAQESETDDSNASRLAIKVAGILGLDVTQVDGAINQARNELREEVAQKKLNALVEKGRLTQEQADEKLKWIQARSQDISGDGKQFLGKKRHYKDWKGHRYFKGSLKYSKGKNSWGTVEKKLNAMVEKGLISKEDAEAKLKWIKAEKTAKAAAQ